MSSEDKTAEASDQGPSALPDDAGDMPAGSPAAADRRPRGRPRKDVLASTPKPRKKVRSRGRASADDDDGTDGTEAAESDDTPESGERKDSFGEGEDDGDSEGDLLAGGLGEDGPLSPMFQHCVSEDSAGSSTLAAAEAKISEQLCAFCYCGEKSLLGQGELKMFGPTPGYVPLHIRNRRGSSENDTDVDRSPERSEAEHGLGDPANGPLSPCDGMADVFGEEPAGKLWGELGQVGLPDDINVQSLFDPTGQCCAHLRCAAWSEGVCRGEGQSLLYVDKAIDSGSTKHCAYCKRLGASIKCCVEKCVRSYHYPCAAATAGTFQDISSRTLHCPEHVQLALRRYEDAANCALCDGPGDLLDRLFCTSCGQHYHGLCLDVTVSPLKRAGWQCPECKVCQTCKNPGEDSKMLVCDMCDKGYHTFCLQPVMDTIPTNGWRCKNCRVCIQCGTRTSGQWHHSCPLCEGCYQQQDSSVPCPLCGKSLKPELHKDLLSCHSCKRWFHADCERQAGGDVEAPQRDDYVCTACKQAERDPAQTQSDPAQEIATPAPEPASDPGSVDNGDAPQGDSGFNTASASEERRDTLSALDPAQEIQVTVTVTERPASPQLVPGSVDELGQSAQGTPAVLVAGVMEVADSVGATKESADIPVEEAGSKLMAASPGEVFSPTKESTQEPMANLEGSVEVSLSLEKGEEFSRTGLEGEGEGEGEGQQVGVLQEGGQPGFVGTSAQVEMETTPPAEMDTTPLVETDSTSQLEMDSTSQVEMDSTSQLEMDSTSQVEMDSTSQLEMDSTSQVEMDSTSQVEMDSTSQVEMDSTSQVEMDTTSASEHSLCELGSPTGDDGEPMRTPETSSGGSAGPGQSPLSVGSSPKEAAPTPPTLATAFIPVMPKIGMGKPAISKRKFSPGRPRVKQGAWSDRSAVSSPSWSPDHSDGWETPKNRQPLTPPLWTVKVGRGSAFPGRRRPRGASLSGRGGRGRSKLKGEICPAVTPGPGLVETFAVKEEEENAMHNTVVLFSSSDSFTLRQDMCVVCGSFGQGAEGRLLACSQCGQCYHPFCVNIKITKVVLSRGWRCLECTVCEACGQATDPGRLLLCDDCDISYHTYCLDPPLQTVPKGGWKCKWCVSCTNCGATTPGLRCEWQNNYTQCAPCASLAACPVCLRNYQEDELIVQCRQCDRWIHASCQNLNTDEEVENAADNAFDCTMCRTHTTPSQVMAATTAPETDSNDPPITAQIVTKAKEPAPEQQRTYTQDGVCLTALGLSQLQGLAAAASKRKRPKPKLKLKIINQNSVAVLQTPPDPQAELSRDEDPEDGRDGDILDCEGKSESSPEREPADEDCKGAEGADGAKKRKRKPYRPGIGGFMVRQRSRTAQGKAKHSLSRKDSSGSVSENLPGKEEGGWNEAMPDTPVEEAPPGLESLEKVKKRYRKKKTKLEEEFPSYLQEAFFGKELLDKSKQARQTPETALSDDDRAQAHSKPPSATASFLDPSSDPLLSAATTPISNKAGALANSEDPLVDLSEVLNTDDDILGMLSGDLAKPGDDSGLGLCPFQVENSPSPFAGLDIGPIPDDPVIAPQPHPSRTQRTLPVEPLDGILSPELDKMVTDGAILSKLYKIPELEGKDVEDLFTAVLSPSRTQPSQLTHPLPPNTVPSTQGPPMPLPNPGDGMFPRMPVMNGLTGPNHPHFPSGPMGPGGVGPCVPNNFSPIQRMPFPENMREKKFNPMRSEMGRPWPAPAPGPAPLAAPLPEGETDTMSNAQRSTLKWEKEETLGELATVAPVLYTNVNFPNLREEFPDWTTRVKQIAKLWRKASSQERAPYVQKARDNRAALRINKVQMSNESMKRQQQQQQPDLFDPSVPLDSESLFKDPLKHKESEHEQEWKFRQGELIQMWGPVKKQQEKVPKTKAIKSSNKEVLFGHSSQATIATGCGKMSLQMRQKSKQQAKIEATQKLEQVKNEQQLQQQQQQQLQYSSQSGGEPASSGNQSPATPQPSNGNTSPLQPINPKEGFPRSQLPVPPSSAPLDDVFVRPQPPPPATARTPIQDTCFQGQQPQASSPQIFPPSTSASRPTSPWDPYAKMVGTPRPPPTGSGTTRRSSVGPQSPAHEPFGSPTSMYSEAYTTQLDTPRSTVPNDPFVKPMGPPRAGPIPEPTGRHAAGGGTGDSFTRLGLRAEVYQRMSHNRMILSDPYCKPLLTPIPGSNESGSVSLFKAPMPPPQSQDPFGSAPSTPRRPAVDSYEKPGFSQNEDSDPYAHPPLTPRPSMNDSFSTPPRMARHPQGTLFSAPLPMSRHPHRDPFTQTPSTPRPDYSQQSPDPYAQPPGTPRPSVDPYALPPGTPRPPVDPYAQPPGTPRPSVDPYAQPPGTPRPSVDPYAQPPGTPRPSADPYGQPPGTPRPDPDPYSQQPFTPRLTPADQYPQQQPIRMSSPSQPVDPYARPPGTPRPTNIQQLGTARLVLNDPYAQPPGTPHPGASHGDPFARPAALGTQTPKQSGMVDDGFGQLQPNQAGLTLAHDPYEQAPVTPRPQSGESFAHDIKDQPGIGHEGTSLAMGHLPNLPQSTGNAPDAQSSGVQPLLVDSEEKLKQRQRLRELILRQQQQKSAIRQEKGLQEPPMPQAPGGPGGPRHWSQEDPGSQNELFSRPPPPYPGMMRVSPMAPGGQRFPGPFLSDQQGPFPSNGQFSRPQFRGIMGMRPHGARFGIPAGGQGGQEHFLRPSQPMQGLMTDVPQQMRRSLSGDLAQSMGGNPTGLHQHFPPRGLQMQQHNIMGQPFIELRHRAPESRLRLSFGPPTMAASDHPQRPPGFGDGAGQEFASNPSTRMGTGVMTAGQPHGMGDHLQISSSLENLHQLPAMTMGAGPQHPPLMRSLSHPATIESFGMAPPTLLPLAAPPAEQRDEIPMVPSEAMEEKLDTEDSAVKDLEDVEVKDLVDDDLENLNLDPDDGKDLDLEANDLHLDDLLTSGNFDILAYTDPELDLGDKKDMFNEELDLNDPVEEHGEASEMQKALSEKRNASSASSVSAPHAVLKEEKPLSATEQSRVKRETGTGDDPAHPLRSELTVKTEVKEGMCQNLEISSCPGQTSDGSYNNQECLEAAQSCAEASKPGSTAILSNLVVQEKQGETRMVPTTIANPLDPVTQANPGLHQNHCLSVPDHPMNPNLRMDPSFAQGAAMGNSGFPLRQPPCQSFGVTVQQAYPGLPMGGQHLPRNLVPQGQQAAFPQDQGPHSTAQHNRPLLLEEQPLLLQDLLDQERQEQQQQRQMQAMIRQRSGDSFPSIDFDAITDPIMKAKMVALKGINKVMVQNNMGMPPMVMNRIQLGGQQVPGEQCPDSGAVLQSAVGQDIKVAQHLARPNPPNLGPGFPNDAQKKQYEDWLKDTQQLLQIQQKFLEEKIGAHRKSKKALSAKQRTAKKAGREFPEEDQEQLRHVTEQQSVVQKQLEQIRKQQKEHAELIEEYRVKEQEQQCSMPPPIMPGAPPQGAVMPGAPPQGAMMPGAPPQGAVMPGAPPQGAMMPGAPPQGAVMPGAPPQGAVMPGAPPQGAMMPGAPPQGAMMPGAPPQGAMIPGPLPMGQPMMSHMMQMQQQHLGQPAPPRMTRVPSWQSGAPGPMGGSGMPPHLPPQMPQPTLPGQLPMAGTKPLPAGAAPAGNGTGHGDGGGAPQVKFDDNNPFSEGFQERERKERLREQQERQRVQLMQEVERQRALQQHLEMEQQQPGILGAETNRMTFYNSDMPHDFMQPQRTPQQQQQQQMGAMFPQQQGMQPGFMALPSGAPFMSGGECQPMPGNGPFSVEMGPNFQSKHPMLPGSGFSLGQPRPVGFGGPAAVSQGGGEGPPFGMELPTPLPPNYPGSGQSLIQLYSNIIPDEKGKKKRNRKKKKDEDAEPVKTPSTPHSDLTAPFTPCVSDTSSTPTRSTLQPVDPEEGTGVSEHLSDQQHKVLSEIKLERVEPGDCSGPRESKLAEPSETVKVEEGKEAASPLSDGQSPAHSTKGESGNELLKHLLKNKGAPHAPPHQIPNDGPHSEDEGSMDSRTPQKHTPTDAVASGKKKQRNKRVPKSVEKTVSRCKKRKKEEEPQMVYSSTDTLMTQLKQQLSLLPLMEPMIGVSFAHFPPYGSGQLNGESRLSGAFGSASLDGVSDYYSQLIYKNNLSNPPTPPASLPPTPPPLARQKMVNGFATTEELARKAAVMGSHDVAKSLVPKQLQTPFRPEDLLARAMAQGPKSVDVPASLPTPPHNNQEELRGQEHCEERDTPESFVPSSSPESVVGVEISRYPDLSLVKEEHPSPAPSPVLPLLPSSSGKATEAKQREVKMEPQSVFPGSLYGQPSNCSKAGLVSIAISLNPAAAQNIPGVVAAVADLLCVKIPGSYEVSSASDRGPLMLLGGTGPQGIMRFLRPPGMMSSQVTVTPRSNGPAAIGGDCTTGKGDAELRAQWCCHCKVVVLGNGVRKSVRDLPCVAQDSQDSWGKEGSLVFCSHNCFILYSAAMQSKANERKPAVTISSNSMVKESPFKIQHRYSNNMSALDVHCLAQLQPKQSPPSTPPISFPVAAPEATLKAEPKPDPLKVTVKLKPRPRAVHNGTDGSPAPGQSPGKRWKGLRWRKWSVHIVVPKGDLRQPDEGEIDELLRRLGASLRPEPLPRDLRQCCFCHEEGDGVTDGPARLLNLDLDLWVHLNCALWSTEVYETQAGALINVELALRRGLSVKCAYCQHTGATSGCHRLRCANVYHFTCALRAQCTFFKDKTMLCHQHRPRGGAQGQELRCFAVFRRVYVQRDEARQVASAVRRGGRDRTFRVGSLVLHAAGQLLPQQMAAFHAPAAIFPAGYEASRIYWSMRHGNRRCRYMCAVDERDGRPEFSVRVLEQGYRDLVLTDTTPKGVWDQVLGPVAERRTECGMLKLFPVYLKGEDLFGLTTSAVTRIIESLPGVEACETYTFRYGRNPLMELPLAFNPTGSARSQPKGSSHVKRPHTLTSICSSKSFQSTVAGEISTPYSKQFVHSKSSQYRKMKAEWKSNVYLARSGIQGLGLYAAKDIEKYTMIIEYIGTIIRNEVANRKEKLYQSQNRGVYMFRIDSEHVIDATITGGPARYINHSCAPNCVAEVVTFEKGHKIIISSNRRIQKGEEMCYDYKFDLEDDQHKIPCHCGAVTCRKWMN
ncbi:histone-lysine N-methyltransferase 2C isoform X3 [Anguilla anguilla]|uniref:histone-lysine N-methyltransferase 2C isoform X3 n=1 Tax=Anguilla anguilla TaxID=7936 RepID=UPI0015AD578F|nr:histone-lysine N-methyltransferase 2C isoform X3 [Anguilla anguilla]